MVTAGLSSGDRRFVKKLMRTFNIKSVKVGWSDSRKKHPDIWCYPTESPPRIVVTSEWRKQGTGERRKRLTHEFLHLAGYEHGNFNGMEYSTYPKKDKFSKYVYRQIILGENPVLEIGPTSCYMPGRKKIFIGELSKHWPEDMAHEIGHWKLGHTADLTAKEESGIVSKRVLQKEIAAWDKALERKMIPFDSRYIRECLDSYVSCMEDDEIHWGYKELDKFWMKHFNEMYPRELVSTTANPKLEYGPRSSWRYKDNRIILYPSEHEHIDLAHEIGHWKTSIGEKPRDKVAVLKREIAAWDYALSCSGEKFDQEYVAAALMSYFLHLRPIDRIKMHGLLDDLFIKHFGVDFYGNRPYKNPLIIHSPQRRSQFVYIPENEDTTIEEAFEYPKEAILLGTQDKEHLGENIAHEIGHWKVGARRKISEKMAFRGIVDISDLEEEVDAWDYALKRKGLPFDEMYIKRCLYSYVLGMEEEQLPLAKKLLEEFSMKNFGHRFFETTKGGKLRGFSFVRK